MKVSTGKYAVALSAALFFTQGALAEVAGMPPLTVERQLAAAFTAPPEAEVMPLTASQMAATEGELWPIIGAVVSIDLALSAYFWGVYVPTVYGSSSGFCVTCYAP